MRTTHSVPRLLAALITAAAVGLTACDRQPEAPVLPAAEPAPAAPAAPEPRPQPPAPIVPTGAPTSFAPLVERVNGAVVNVDVQVRGGQASRTRGGGGGFEDFFGFRQPRRQQPLQEGSGSGFIVSPEGRVVTNNHVVEGAVAIRVRLSDGSSYSAEIVGRDPLTDLALLQLSEVKSALPTVAFGDSDALSVGDWVVAVGNPFGLSSSVSAGILSARSRDIRSGPYDDFLQTDAAINPGNSGGPLFNLAGEVIGINTAIIGGASGIGFAVPSNMAKQLMPQLEKGVVRRGWLGVSVSDVEELYARALELKVKEGALVQDVGEGTPGEAAGLQAKDVVVSVNGKAIRGARELTQRLGLLVPGTQVKLEVVRDGATQPIEVTLGERPDYEGVGVPTAAGPGGALGKLGLSVTDAGSLRDARIAGALVTAVAEGSPAEAAGLREGMLIVEAARQRVGSAADLTALLSKARSGDTVILVVASGRGGSLRALRIP